MSRPRTPATTSDTFSDLGSLSDLESGWTDLSSNRSGGRFRTFSVTSDPSDEEDVFEERLEEETWEGVLHSDSEVGASMMDERALVPEYNPPPMQAVSEPDSMDLYSSSTSFALPDNPVVSGSSSQCSIRGSQTTLRLSFPDPLSDSREDILSPHVAHAEFGQASRQINEVIVSKDSKGAGIVDEKNSCSIVEDDSSPKFAIILLGYNPLRSLKSSLLDFLLNAVATSLEGPPILTNDLQLSRTFCVPFRRKLMPEQICSGTDVDLDYIFISDRTSTLDARPLETLRCPTLAVVFLQPPNRCPQLPMLPANVKYLPILLHSLGNDSISSLLDLSPSILFDKAQLNIIPPGNTSRQHEALQQCEELDILESRIDGSSAEVLTVEQLTTSSSQDFANKLTETYFSEDNKTRRFIKEKFFGLSSKSVIVFFAMFFPMVFLLSNIMGPFQIFAYRSTRHISVQETIHPVHAALATNMAKTLGISVIRYETKSLSPLPVLDSTTLCLRRTYSSSVQRSPATLEPSPPILTLDPPLIKALTLAPAKSVIKKITVGAESITRRSDSLAIRLTSALAPLLDVISRDMQDLLDVIDAFLRAVRELQDQIVHGFGGIVNVIKEQANQGIRDLSNKVSSVVHSLGEMAFHRHTRAQDNARQMRATGEHLVNVAKQRFEARMARARRNAHRGFNGRLFNVLDVGNGDIKDNREPRRRRWGCSINRKGQYCV